MVLWQAPQQNPQQDPRRRQHAKSATFPCGPDAIINTPPPAHKEARRGPHAASIAIALLRAWGAFIRLFCVPLHALTRLQLFAYSTSRLTCVFARKRTSRASLRMSAPDTIVSCNKLLSQETLFLRRANHANGCAAIGTLPLRDRLTVFRNALNRVNHDFLRLALNAISFFCCHRRQPFWSGARERKHYWNGDDSP